MGAIKTGLLVYAVASNLNLTLVPSPTNQGHPLSTLASSARLAEESREARSAVTKTKPRTGKRRNAGIADTLGSRTVDAELTVKPLQGFSPEGRLGACEACGAGLGVAR